MNNQANILAVRALNHWRKLYQPSYLGLRLFLEQLPQSSSSDFLQQYLHHKFPLRQQTRFRKFAKFKGFDTDRSIQFRDMYAASPSTALAESYALNALLKVDTLRDRSYVYSYRRPMNEKSGGDYRYYYSGYRQRNHNVSELLKKYPHYRLIVNDLRSYYRSISTETVMKRFAIHIKGVKNKNSRELVNAIVEQTLSVTDKGIPVGPALAHLFGNIAQEEVDNKMFSLLGDRYLRYVDDIYMVLEPSEIQQMNMTLNSVLEAEGFKLNDDKYDELSSDDWHDNNRTIKENLYAREFAEIIERLKLFIWHEPSKRFMLQKIFRDSGIPMPIQTFALSALYGRFQVHMKTKFSSAKQYYRYITSVRTLNESELFSKVIALGKQFYDVIQEIENPDSTDHPQIRKMRVQRIRYFSNRLLYLTPTMNYQQQFATLPNIDELYEHRCLVQAITESELQPLLQVSGYALATFASVCKELEYEINMEELPSPDTLSIFDSVCHLVSMGIIKVPPNYYETLSDRSSELPDRSSELLRFCECSSGESRTITNHFYEDEMHSLQLNTDARHMQKIIETRFSDVDQINLDALLYDENYS